MNINLYLFFCIYYVRTLFAVSATKGYPVQEFMVIMVFVVKTTKTLKEPSG